MQNYQRLFFFLKKIINFNQNYTETMTNIYADLSRFLECVAYKARAPVVKGISFLIKCTIVEEKCLYDI